MKGHNPHDSFYKSCMEVMQVPREFCLAHLPAYMLERLQLDSLKREPMSFIDEAFKHYHSDIVLSAEIKGKTGYIYLIFEHQSSPDQHMVSRMIHYCIRLIAAHKNEHNTLKIPIIYPAIFYHGDKSPYP